jgi:hypothetical protein
MKKILLIGAAVAACAAAATWNGEISDAACGASHAKMMAEHKDLKTDRECTLACVKGGSQYVLVSEGKVFKIDNQNFAALQQRAGQMVEVTGDLKGDTITVSKIAAATKKK